MQKRIRRELGKSRELLWHFLDGQKCCFCHKPLVNVKAENIRFGNATAKPIDLKITIHHKDGDHSNNEKSNRKLAHTTCHKRHHVKGLTAHRLAVATNPKLKGQFRTAA